MTTVATSTRVDAHRFKHAMASFASGVNIVSIYDDDGRPYGMTANAFSSVSLDPFLVLVCVNRDTRTHELLGQIGRFGVSVLTRDAAEIADHCAQPGAGKQLHDEWLARDEASRTPVLQGAIVHIDCNVYAEHLAGTHTVFIGEVRHITSVSEADPLVYYRGRYREIVPRDDLAE